MRDLRSQVIAAVTTLVATIAGFYFGAESARQGSQSGSAGSAPIFKHDPKDPVLVVGYPGSYAPVLTGTPAPVVSLSQGALPAGLQLDSATGVISGTPAAGTANTYTVTLTAKNGVSPDATLAVTLTVAPGYERYVVRIPINAKFERFDRVRWSGVRQPDSTNASCVPGGD